jgi:hypothetical protein
MIAIKDSMQIINMVPWYYWIFTMEFKGRGSISHFLRLESHEGLLESVRSLYRLFVSAIRAYNIQFGESLNLLFLGEYSEVSLHDESLHSSAKLFVTRECAEKQTWKRSGSILEIGVAPDYHAISLISNTSASSYIGIDINFAQLTDNSKQRLKHLSAHCHITFCSVDSR